MCTSMNLGCRRRILEDRDAQYICTCACNPSMNMIMSSVMVSWGSLMSNAKQCYRFSCHILATYVRTLSRYSPHLLTSHEHLVTTLIQAYSITLSHFYAYVVIVHYKMLLKTPINVCTESYMYNVPCAYDVCDAQAWNSDVEKRILEDRDAHNIFVTSHSKISFVYLPYNTRM